MAISAFRQALDSCRIGKIADILPTRRAVTDSVLIRYMLSTVAPAPV